MISNAVPTPVLTVAAVAVPTFRLRASVAVCLIASFTFFSPVIHDNTQRNYEQINEYENFFY